MEKTAIVHILYFIIFISSISTNNYILASGNTFSIPPDNKENNSYYTYNIENNKKQYNNESYVIGNKPSSTPPANKTKTYTNRNYNKNKTSNNSSVTIKKKTKKLPAKNNKSSRKNNTSQKTIIKTITKIEFQKHFIKIPAGNSEEILFTITPAKTSGLKFIYKSSDNSIVIFKDKKLTALKKGFATILIMLPDGTIKAACPVKVI